MKMPPSVLAAFGLVLGIVGLAGFVDAYSFVQFKELFVSFMSGNTTSLGVAVAEHNASRAAQLAQIIGLFVGGVVLGTLLRHWVGRQWAPTLLLVLVAALLLLAHEYPVLGAGGLTLAMGVLNASVHKIGEVPVSLTFFTGALVKLGTSLANLLSGQPAAWDWVWQLALWGCFLGGSVGGASLARHHSPGALPLAAGVGLALALLASLGRGIK